MPVLTTRAIRSPAALLLAGALIYFLLIGGTDAGRHLTALRAVGAVISAAVILWCLATSSRFTERTDRLIVLSLIAFVATCVLSQFPRFSFDAATMALALTAAFLIARDLLNSERARELLVAVLGLCGFVLAVAFVLLWGSVWLRWLATPGAGLPPLDLILPVGPYRHYHVVGMTIALLLPALIALILRGGLIRPVGLIGVLAAVAVIVMSGSRTVWLAALVGLSLPLAARGARALQRIHPAVYVAVGVGVLLLVVSGAAGPIVNRLAGTSTIALRSEIWGATLDRWLAHPLTGSGPGTFSVTLTLSDYFGRFPDVGRHADNAVIQLLAEGGLLGLLSLGLLAAGIVAGVRDWKGIPWAPAAGVLVFVMGSFTDNPSDTTSVVVIALAWTALAVPRLAGSPHVGHIPHRFPILRRASFGAGLVIVVATSLTLLAGWSFDQAAAAARRGDAMAVVERLSDAVRLDPAHALYRRERGVWSAALGRTTAGERDLRLAYALNPADATAARALAILASVAGEDDAAINWAERAVRLKGTHARNGLTLAYVAAEAGERERATTALIAVLVREPWIAAAPDWAALFPSGESLQLLLSEAQRAAAATPSDSRSQLASAWLAAEAGVPVGPNIPLDAAASAAIIDCRLADAMAAVDAMPVVEAVSSDGLQARVFVATATNDPSRRQVVDLAGLRWPVLGILATEQVLGASPFSDPSADITLYRRLPMPAPDLGPILPTANSGMSAWLRDPAAAADQGAPGSALARCA